MIRSQAYRTVLTAEEAARAIYLDFEGRKDEAPAFVGSCWDAPRELRFEQAVLDVRLHPAARAKGLWRAGIKAYLKDLASWVESEDRVVVAWSERELRVFEGHARPADLDVLRGAYRNAVRLAKRYRRDATTSGDQAPPVGNDLAAWLAYFEYQVPSGQGNGIVADAIRDVRQGLETHGTYEALTPVMKGKWTRALGHNRHDCAGMRHVCRKITGLGV